MTIAQYKPKRPDTHYLMYQNVLDGRDEDIRARTTKIVTTATPHDCCGHMLVNTNDDHVIAVGTRTFSDRAIVDGSLGSYYICLQCFDVYLDSENL
jgi:hypothetical protein